MISYDPESCHLVGRVVNVCVDEAYLDEIGKVNVDKLQPITYNPMHHRYLTLGSIAGLAFHDGIALK